MNTQMENFKIVFKEQLGVYFHLRKVHFDKENSESEFLDQFFQSNSFWLKENDGSWLRLKNKLDDALMFQNKLKRKVLYLHGLESKQGGPKVEFLQKQNFLVLAPSMDYKEESKNCIIDLAGQLQGEEFDLIIGSSIGGYAAYHLAKNLYVKQLMLLNPALSQQSIVLNKPQEKHQISASINLHLGKHDEVIDPKATLDFLHKEELDYSVFYYDYGHRTPMSTFENHYWFW